MSDKPSIYEALTAAMTDVQAIGKDGRNTQQNYSFRGVDAVMNAAGPAFRKHGIIAVPTVEDASYRDVLVGKNQTPQRECTLRVRYTFYGPAGDSIESVVAAEALDSGDKATAKAHSVAYRTCLLQTLTIPTHDTDPDASSPERAASNGSAPPPVLTPIQQAWKRQREAIERGVGKENAAVIQARLNLDNTDEKHALLLAAAIEHFERTGELPQAQQDSQEPPGDYVYAAADSLVARLYDLAGAATDGRRSLLLRVHKVVVAKGWEDADVKAVLGSNRRNIAKALEALDDADLERAVVGLEDAAKATS